MRDAVSVIISNKETNKIGTALLRKHLCSALPSMNSSQTNLTTIVPGLPSFRPYESEVITLTLVAEMSG